VLNRRIVVVWALALSAVIGLMSAIVVAVATIWD
jgi:hypothetical protein